MRNSPGRKRILEQNEEEVRQRVREIVDEVKNRGLFKARKPEGKAGLEEVRPMLCFLLDGFVDAVHDVVAGGRTPAPQEWPSEVSLPWLAT